MGNNYRHATHAYRYVYRCCLFFNPLLLGCVQSKADHWRIPFPFPFDRHKSKSKTSTVQNTDKHKRDSRLEGMGWVAETWRGRRTTVSDTRGDLMDLIALCSSYNRLDEYTYAHLCPAPSLPPSLLPSSSPLSMSSLVSPCLSRVRSSASVPLASIGILTDIQCADVENGWNFLKTEQRYYRHALTATRRAIQALHRSSTPVRFVIHLGDLIDGLNAGLDNEHRASERMLTEAMKILPQPSRNRIIPLAADTHHDAPMQSYSLIGNHELMNFPRSRWANVLGLGKLSEESRAAAATAKQQSSSSSIPSSPARTYRFTYDHSHEHHHPAVATEEANESSKSTSAVSSSSSTAPYTSLSPLYYDLDIGGAYRLLMIDTYEISVLGYTDILPQPTPSQLATTFLELENPNENKNSPLNLEGREKRKVAFNGGLSSRQMEWIRDVLTDCRRLGQSALICSHVTIHHDACHPSALVWNQDELLDLIHRFKDVVIGCLSGHDHDGGHFVDQDGITHHTFEAILTAADGHDAYGRMDFYEDGIDIVGTGELKSFHIRRHRNDENNAATTQADTADNTTVQ